MADAVPTPPPVEKPVWGLLGPLTAEPAKMTHTMIHAGRLVRVHSVADLPESVIYWCHEGDQEWTPIPEAIRAADLWWTERCAVKNAKLAKKRMRRQYIELRAFEEGKTVEQVEAETGLDDMPE